MAVPPPMGAHMTNTMNQKSSDQTPVMEALRKAGVVHARQRALMFLLRSLMWIIIAIPVILIADVLIHFSDNWRLSGLVGIIAAITITLITAICMSALIRPPTLRIARLLESRNPKLGSKLINILQLADTSKAPNSDALTRDLALKAIHSSSESLDIRSLPPLAKEPRMSKNTWQTVSAAITLGILTLVGGHSAKQQWLRFIDPMGDHPPFSLTHLSITKPTDSDLVEYAGSFTVEAVARGHQPSDLFLTAVTTGEEPSSITLPMYSRGDGTFLAQLENITQPLEITVHTANEESRSHRRQLNLILTPQIKSASIQIVPPAYTRLPTRKTKYRFTSVQALEGSEIKIELKSNRPLGDGSTQLEIANEAVTNLPLAPDGNDDPKVATTQLVAEKSGRMTFFIVDIDGNAAAKKPSSLLTVTTDLPPEIAIASPEKNAFIVENFMTPVTIDASDDYGLRTVRLHVSINEEFVDIAPVTFEEPSRQHTIEHPLDLAALGAKPGDAIAIFAEAVDNRPEPQMSRTSTLEMVVISEDAYNRYLREQADVAMIAGKYESLLDRFEEQIEEQRQITEELEKLKKELANGEEKKDLLDEFSKQYARQAHLNEQLKRMADEMNEFGREDPLYDFEKELQEKLKKQADAIKESVEKNQADAEKAAGLSPKPPEDPTKETIEDMAQAAKEQMDRLAGEQKMAEESVEKPLKELAQLHELMKDFKRFEELAEKQKEIAGQAKAYEKKEQLDPLDQLAMRELGAKQRELAQELDQLTKKLRHDADAAEDNLPKAADSARELADKIEKGNMPDLARKAAGNMLKADADKAHAQAHGLQQLMEQLLENGEMPERQQAANELDRILRLQRRMNPGDSFRQMMMSRNFRPLPGAAGQNGMMNDANANSLLLGGESLMDGSISREIAGKGNHGNSGRSGGPTAKIDRADKANVAQEFSRRTSTPNGSSLLLEYESIADAYFRRLTAEP